MEKLQNGNVGCLLQVRHGGAETAAWEELLEMESVDLEEKQEELGAVSAFREGAVDVCLAVGHVLWCSAKRVDSSSWIFRKRDKITVRRRHVRTSALVDSCAARLDMIGDASKNSDGKKR